MGSAGKQKGLKRFHSLSNLSNSMAPQPPHDTRKDLHGHAGAAAGGDLNSIRTDAEAHRDDGSDFDADACDLVLDGATEDEMLKGADALTEEEVVRRRARRIKQLIRLYRMQYWGLLEELRAKYRLFYLKHGRSGWRDDIDTKKHRVDAMEFFEEGNVDSQRIKAHDAIPKEPPSSDKIQAETMRCATQGCKSKPLALSTYCFGHILSDPRQQLYRGCTHVIRSGQSGSITCGKPVLRSVLFCPMHLQKQASRRKPTTTASFSAISKPGPKLHLVIAEYVKHIQSKRKVLRERASQQDRICNSKEQKVGSTTQDEDALLPVNV